MKSNNNLDRLGVFILSHGRADRVVTHSTLRKAGYTGPIHIVIDNEDKAADDYIKNFGTDRVHIFDKLDISNRIDTACNFGKRGAIVYARNAVFEIAQKLGYDFLLQLDDDYQAFEYTFTQDRKYRPKTIAKNIENLFDAFVQFLIDAPKVDTIAFAQGGDFIGGGNNARANAIKVLRKAMNSFFCRTDRPLRFQGAINEDVNLYTAEAIRGGLFMTHNGLRLVQIQTQSNTGGMTELYLDSGTYVKSFYSVIFAPSCVTVKDMGHTHRRLHHAVLWNHTIPKILSQ